MKVVETPCSWVAISPRIWVCDSEATSPADNDDRLVVDRAPTWAAVRESI